MRLWLLIVLALSACVGCCGGKNVRVGDIQTFTWNKRAAEAEEWTINEIQQRSDFRALARRTLQHKRLVIMGDSLSRYGYMNLVYFLHTGNWSSPFPRNEVEHDWGGWKPFHLGTSARLGGAELCDCYREAGPLGPFKENRHYLDAQHNFSIHFFLWLPPSHALKLHAIPAGPGELPSTKVAAKRYKPTLSYSFDTVEAFIQRMLVPLRPDVLLINQGFWAYPRLRDDVGAFIRNISGAAARVIWKTTTATRAAPLAPTDDAKFMAALAAHGVEVYDAYNATKQLASPLAYWDNLHFVPFVYRELNKLLILQLAS